MGKKSKKILLKSKNLLLVKRDGYIFGQNRNKRRNLDPSGLVVFREESRLSSFVIDDLGLLHAMFEVDPDELFEFAQNIKKEREKFKGKETPYFRHFTPELTFVVKEKDKPIKKPKQKAKKNDK